MFAKAALSWSAIIALPALRSSGTVFHSTPATDGMRLILPGSPKQMSLLLSGKKAAILHHPHVKHILAF